jgi:hypothetical protein
VADTVAVLLVLPQAATEVQAVEVVLVQVEQEPLVKATTVEVD